MSKPKPIMLPEQIANYLDETVGRDKVGRGDALELILEEMRLKDRFIRWFQTKFGDEWQFVLADCARYGWDKEEELYYLILPGVTGELSNGITLGGHRIGHGGHKFKPSEIKQHDPRYLPFLVKAEQEL